MTTIPTCREAGSQAGGVAYAAHVGGFVAGLLLVKIFAVGHAAT